MTATVDAPALARLADLESVPTRSPGQPRSAGTPKMGYQPGLDGLRAISVVAVMLYHAGFEWMHGGFFGVEVFFVVSGFLITSLLLEEWGRDDRIALGQFWLRRGRRLLPALFTMLLAVGVWATFWGDEHLAQLRHDVLAAVFYVSNWWQVFFTDVPYFAPADPPLLRHLWSLAVEEQWYLIWPLVFVALMRKRTDGGRGLFAPLVAVVLGINLVMALAFDAADAGRTNFLYLSTFTRASGLLLGAAAAFVWKPWRWAGAARRDLPWLDAAGFAAVAGLLMMFVPVRVTSAFVYRGGMLVVSVLSVVAIAAVVHPGARWFRRVMSERMLVEMGKRSYGLYLWHWPIFVFMDVRADPAVRFWPAMLVAVVLSELSYRFVETPVRKGVIGRWFAGMRVAQGEHRREFLRATSLFATAAVVLVFALGARLWTAPTFDVAKDDTAVAFDASAVGAPAVAAAAPATSAAAAPPVTAAVLPRSVVVVGDSQAHSLAINLPDGIESTFAVTDGSVEGCGVFDGGSVVSARSSFNRSFDDCAGWAQEWATAAQGADVALVVLGAWDVFDLELDDGTTLAFGSPAFDTHYLAQLQQGIDALVGAGSQVALLEAACMRPVEAEGAGVPPLPERADDGRIAHVNQLLRQAAAANPGAVTFVEGPDAWCADEAIATDVAYRWDGVHVYKPGANLIYETIAPALLAIPVT